MKIQYLKEKVLAGESITKEEASSLEHADVGELASAADEIRKRRAGNIFSLCSIINAKSGRCSENCKFCAQSAAYSVCVKEYPLISAGEALAEARCSERRGVGRVARGNAGRARSGAALGKARERY